MNISKKKCEFDDLNFKGEIHRIEGDEFIAYQILLPLLNLYCSVLYYDKQEMKFRSLKNATYHQQRLANEIERRINNYPIDLIRRCNTFKMT